MKNRSYFILFIISFIYANTINYQINLFGLNVAKCTVNTSDTIIYNQKGIKIEYFVQSTNLMDWIFSVDNQYTTIINKNNYNILYYRKKSFQPNVKNDISTTFKNGNIFYKDTNLKIDDNDYNIFSLLYIISLGVEKFEKDNFIVDREGKKYLGKLDLTDFNTYKLDLDAINNKNFGAEEHTDIFSWALFLPGTRKTIKFDPEKNIISFCSFTKNFLKFSAKFKE